MSEFPQRNRWSIGVLLAGIFIGAVITQGMPYWDGDFTIFFRAIEHKSLAALVGDLISPVSADTRNWGFLDHTLQLVLYKISYGLVGYNAWPYVWFRILCFGSIGLFIYLWGVRLLASVPRGREASAAAALLFLIAPAPVASMSWIADFAPVAEVAVAGLGFLIWAEIERTPVQWTGFPSFGDGERRNWVLRWTALTFALFIAFKTKSDVKLMVAVVGAYLALTRRSQWRLFLPPLMAMAMLAVPWNPAIFDRVPPFLPGGQGGSENFMWQPAKLERLSEFLWASNPFDWHSASMSLAGLLGPFLLAGIAVGFLAYPHQGTAFSARSFWRWVVASSSGRAHLFVMLWLGAILAGATALPEINYFFRIRYGILTLLPVSILLASVFGWFIKVRSTLPRVVFVGGLVLFGLQLLMNADRSVRYRREFARVEVGVDQAYEWIAKNYPNDDLVLMPDFLAYDYHLDAPKAIQFKRRVGGVEDILRTSFPNRTTVLSWQPSSSPLLKNTAEFTGCSGTLFDRIFGCAPGLSIHAMRYVVDGAPGMPAAPTPQTAQAFLDRSYEACQKRQSQDCIAAAKEAIRLKPDFAEAYNNIAAAYEDLGMWDEAITAAKEAVRLKPDFQLAKNNLAWSESQKKINAPAPKH